ncbi:hypothetical protein B0T25DRAFT_274346 [Lasiosphaeria hispida]|uniref:Secreted protein n=1 Tax=Lasiosphaeria hispida TaxID=260671 RepID=A0AAJ0HB07_9PEZI|nr:hypothetical protein B0T25DRAFT_274346 [Lasiosphaeria hispida]
MCFFFLLIFLFFGWSIGSQLLPVFPAHGEQGQCCIITISNRGMRLFQTVVAGSVMVSDYLDLDRGLPHQPGSRWGWSWRRN